MSKFEVCVNLISTSTITKNMYVNKIEYSSTISDSIVRRELVIEELQRFTNSLTDDSMDCLELYSGHESYIINKSNVKNITIDII